MNRGLHVHPGETAFDACAIAPEFVDEALVAPAEADDGDCVARRTTAGARALAGAVAISARSARRA